MPEIPWHGPDQPYETTLGHAHFADGVVVATVKLPEHPDLGKASGKPAILFEFGQSHPDGPAHMWPPMILTFGDDEDPAALVRLVTAAVGDLERVATLKVPAAPPAPAEVHCPGCDVRLHGAVAARGACLACFPTIPGDEERGRG